MPVPSGQDAFASRAYVVGEILISLAALVGGSIMVFFGGAESTKLVGSGMVSAVTALWFARRQGEQSNNNLAMLANGKLTQVLESTQNQQRETQQLALLVAAKHKAEQ